MIIRSVVLLVVGMGQVYGNASAVAQGVVAGAWTCDSCLVLRALHTLGDTSYSEPGPDALEAVTFVAGTTEGTVWIGQINSFKVFNHAGVRVADVGRAGQGPGEFGNYPGPIFGDHQGLVHVLDLRNDRESVFDSDFRLVEEYRLGQGVFAAAALPELGVRVYNASIHDGQSAGKPLHVVDPSGVRRSFGDEGREGMVREFDLRRLLATSPGGRTCASKVFDYQVTCWGRNGEVIARLTGPTINASPVPPGIVSIAYGPPSKVLAVAIVQEARLWILWHKKVPDWKDRIEEVLLPSGAIGFRPLNGDSSSLYEVHLHVVEIDTGRLLAARQVASGMAGFLGDGLLWQMRATGLGVPFVTTWSALLR